MRERDLGEAPIHWRTKIVDGSRSGDGGAVVDVGGVYSEITELSFSNERLGEPMFDRVTQFLHAL